MKVTHIVADGRFSDPVLRDSTPDEDAAMAAILRARIDADHEAALREDAMRSAMAQLRQQDPALAKALYAVISAAGLASWVPGA